MADKNADGFLPGQAVSFEEIQAANATRNMAAPITRESIAEMKKADVVELLDAHGFKDMKGPVAELRDMATELLFVEV